MLNHATSLARALHRAYIPRPTTHTSPPAAPAQVKKPHYMKGGPMGLQCDPLGIYENMTPEMRKVRHSPY